MLPVVRLGVFSVLPGLWLENALPVGFVKGLYLHVGGAHLAHGFPGLPEQFPGLSTGVGAVVAGAAVRVVEEVLPVGIDDGEVAVIHRKQRDFAVCRRRVDWAWRFVRWERRGRSFFGTIRVSSMKRM